MTARAPRPPENGIPPPPVIDNPFPGSRPYRRASDRPRFFAREAISYKLRCAILANRCVALFGPAGSGRTSLMRAGVLPGLVESDDIRVVLVEAWPGDKDPTAWLAKWMSADLRQGEIPFDVTPHDAVVASARRAVRSSPRIVVLFLDHMEQLVHPPREAAAVDTLFDAVLALVELPLRAIRVVLSLREDYLGRLSDRLKDRKRLLADGFRVVPLTVAELTEAVCRTAALGDPSMVWSPEEIGALMLQVRAPGQASAPGAETQAAYGQIVCRALFQRLARGEVLGPTEMTAEAILHEHLEESLAALGDSREAAQRMMETQLVDADGAPTLRTEKELLLSMPQAKLAAVLRSLEKEAILLARDHHGTRSLQIGHDCLARGVFDLRREREEADREAEQSARESSFAAAAGPTLQERIELGRLRREGRTLRALVLILSALLLATAALAAHAWRRMTSAVTDRDDRPDHREP